MASSRHTSNKKTSTREQALAPPEGGGEGAGEGGDALIALVQKARGRARVLAPGTNAAQERLWAAVLEMRECDERDLVAFTSAETHFLFETVTHANCGRAETAYRIAQLYEFRKVFDIYWKSAKSNRNL